jgi:hypothetical protein
MRPFAFLLHHDERRTPSVALEAFADAQLAIDHARDLLDREPRYEKIVVMEAEAELAEIAR